MPFPSTSASRLIRRWSAFRRTVPGSAATSSSRPTSLSGAIRDISGELLELLRVPAVQATGADELDRLVGEVAAGGRGQVVGTLPLQQAAQVRNGAGAAPAPGRERGAERPLLLRAHGRVARDDRVRHLAAEQVVVARLARRAGVAPDAEPVVAHLERQPEQL